MSSIIRTYLLLNVAIQSERNKIKKETQALKTGVSMSILIQEILVLLIVIGEQVTITLYFYTFANMRGKAALFPLLNECQNFTIGSFIFIFLFTI